jgi:hypothetical protein
MAINGNAEEEKAFAEVSKVWYKFVVSQWM